VLVRGCLVTDLALLVVSVALVDSLNPGTIVPALYLATGPRAVRAVLGFAAGYFAVNVCGGVAALVLGHELAGHVPHPSQGRLHAGEVVVGLIAIAAAGVLWHKRHGVEAAAAGVETRITRVAPVAGATIAAAELPTALPYFAVIAALAGSEERTVALIGLVVLFNVIFLAPVVAIALLRAFAGPRAVDLLTRARRVLLRYAGVLAALVVLALGIALVAIGLVGQR
jgi:cytochrome c biogenesis protein CcdA